VFGVAGLTSTVVPHTSYTDGDLDDADLVVVGPGPGDPRDGDDPKIATFRRAVDRLLSRRQPFLAVCLGHQVLCERLGIPLTYKDIVFQGTQDEILIEGRRERVGFYNTFVGRVDRSSSTDAGTPLPEGVSVDADPETGDVHLVRGPHFRGIQFHAESILSEHGSDLVHRLCSELLTG
jgi:2-amino-4-deoxychorismate synthase